MSVATYYEVKKIITKSSHVWTFQVSPYALFISLVFLIAGLYLKSRIVPEMALEDVDGHKQLFRTCLIGSGVFALFILRIKRIY